MKLLKFIANLMREGAQESSKRFLSIFIVCVPFTYVVIRYTTESNLIAVITVLSSLVVALAGVGTWKLMNDKKYSKDEATTKEI